MLPSRNVYLERYPHFDRKSRRLTLLCPRILDCTPQRNSIHEAVLLGQRKEAESAGPYGWKCARYRIFKR